MQDTAFSLKNHLAANWNRQAAKTRTLLQAIPDRDLGFKPHEKSWTLGQLATHMSMLPLWLAGVLGQNELDLGQQGGPNIALGTAQQIIEQFDRNHAMALQALERVTDEQMHQPWTLRQGPQVYQQLSRLDTAWESVMNHLAHHRGQLALYLRLCNVPVPSTMGPTADFPEWQPDASAQ